MRFVALAGALALTLTLTGTARAQDGEAAELKFGTLAPDNTPWSEILKGFKRSLQKSTQNKVRVKVYLNGQLGDEAAMLQKMKFGQLTGGGFTSGGLSTVVPEMQVLEIPFLFRTDAEADYIMDEIVRKDFDELCAKRGLHLYIWAVNGWHDFGSKTKGLAEVAAFAGVKAHMQETDVQRALWMSLKAVPVPLAVPDVLNGLQRGMVDTYSTTPIYASASQWITQTKHWTDSNHVYQPAVVVFDKKWWDGLDPELRKSVETFAPELQAAARKDVRGLDEDLMEELRANGVTIHTLRADERKALMDATSGVADKLIEDKVFERALYEKIVAALTEYRAKSGEGK